MERDSHVPFLGGDGDRSYDRRNPNPFVACYWVDNHGAIHIDTGKVLDGKSRDRDTNTFQYRYRHKSLK